MVTLTRPNRRAFLKSAGAGVATATLAAPAVAQTAPELRWRLTSSFPKSIDVQFGASEAFAKHVSELTDGKFQIQVFAAGEIVPGLQAADAVTNGTVEMCHTASYYYVGKDPTFTFGTCLPFGLNARQTNSWMYNGGGIELLNEFYTKFNIFALPCGNTGAQMGGWFRKEIKSRADLSGVKMRIGGFAGRIIAKLGMVPQQIAAGDIYPALEKGTIDATEWVGPYDDEKLGFYKIAPHYYYPGWWEGGPCISVMINLEKWNNLPKQYQAAVTNAAAHANHLMLGRYDLQNPIALKRLLSNGVQLHTFPQDVMEASYSAAIELYSEISATNASFAKIYESYKAFRTEALVWHQFCEYAFDTFNFRSQQRKR